VGVAWGVFVLYGIYQRLNGVLLGVNANESCKEADERFVCVEASP